MRKPLARRAATVRDIRGLRPLEPPGHALVRFGRREQMPQLSIVTPSLNQGHFIERTIRSVLDQADEIDFEYLVVDGGSQDGTLAILRCYEQRLRWISEPDRGQANAVNKGLQLTTGEIIGWLNSDDIYYPRVLATVQHLFAANPDVDVVYGDADHIDERDACIEPYPTQGWDFERLKDVCYLCQPAVFFRRRVVDTAGGLDERLHYCMDYEYWLRLAQRGSTFLYVPLRLAGSRLYPATKTLSQRVRVHAEMNDMLRRRLGRVPDRWLFNYAHAVLQAGPIRIPPEPALRFALAVSALSIYASLRWNHDLSPGVRETTSRWIAGNLRSTLRGAMAR